ncbi:hypothetical protein K492DRAFT_153667 [Lichtheimia hyalospora FSU 10163]|nr:hypothetical protein K492DRAFT_153667 [Lichtheimia hyalospora FSU 10163]
MRSFLTIALAATALLQGVAAAGGAPITLELVDSTNFCTFLPPADSEDRNIARTEFKAEVFCMGSTPNADAAGTLADGFIQSAHFVATDHYIQVTGQIDPVKMNLDPADEGGQYDIVMPKGAVCAGGWKHFVNLIEPSSNTYCLRCCHSKSDCNRGISEKGCQHIIPGDYSGPMDGSGPSNGGDGNNNNPPPTTTSAPEPSNSPEQPSNTPEQPSSSPEQPSSSPEEPSSDVPLPPLASEAPSASNLPGSVSESASSSSAPSSSADTNAPSDAGNASQNPEASSDSDEANVSAQAVNDESGAMTLVPALGTAAGLVLASIQWIA